MTVDDLAPRLDGIPHMAVAQARVITDLVLEHRFESVLELGFRHGVSTCYIAAALDRLGGGTVTTIDLDLARSADPNVETLLARFGLADYATVHYEPTSYTWRLMRMLEADPTPRFDFCYLDGAHDWFVDGFAFYLVDRLLKPGGLIVFDDLDWTYARSPTLRNTPRVQAMPEDERATPQVRQVYELLVKPHPDYERFMEKDDWAYAWKRLDAQASGGAIRREVVVEREHVGLGGALLRVAKRLAR